MHEDLGYISQNFLTKDAGERNQALQLDVRDWALKQNSWYLYDLYSNTITYMKYNACPTRRMRKNIVISYDSKYVVGNLWGAAAGYQGRPSADPTDRYAHWGTSWTITQ